MFILVANFYQFKGATTLWKILFMKLKIYVAKFLQLNIVNNHNIERFKQVSNYITCL